MAVDLNDILKVPPWLKSYFERRHSMIKDCCLVPCLECNHACRNHDGGEACDVEGCDCKEFKGDPGELN